VDEKLRLVFVGGGKELLKRGWPLVAPPMKEARHFNR
jgi:hypothetical protein